MQPSSEFSFHGTRKQDDSCGPLASSSFPFKQRGTSAGPIDPLARADKASFSQTQHTRVNLDPFTDDGGKQGTVDRQAYKAIRNPGGTTERVSGCVLLRALAYRNFYRKNYCGIARARAHKHVMDQYLFLTGIGRFEPTK